MTGEASCEGWRPSPSLSALLRIQARCSEKSGPLSPPPALNEVFRFCPGGKAANKNEELHNDGQD